MAGTSPAMTESVPEECRPTPRGALIAAAIYAAGAEKIAKDGGPGFGGLIASYATTAILSGTILGLARPLVKTPLGLGFVGFLTALPVAILIMWFSRDGQWHLINGSDVGIGIGIAAFIGPVGAAYVHIRERDRRGRDG